MTNRGEANRGEGGTRHFLLRRAATFTLFVFLLFGISQACSERGLDPISADLFSVRFDSTNLSGNEAQQLDPAKTQGCPSDTYGTYPDCYSYSPPPGECDPAWDPNCGEPDPCDVNPWSAECSGDPCATDPYGPGCDPCAVDPYASGCYPPDEGTTAHTGLVDGSDDPSNPTGDNCTDIGYSASIGSGDNFDKATFASYLRANAEPVSTGKCARYVRRALCNGGISAVCEGGPDAWKYGPFLQKLGFSPVATGSGLGYPPGYTPQVGDIAVFAYAPYGHVCAWDGSSWISDFVQQSIQPNSGNPIREYTIYRKP